MTAEPGPAPLVICCYDGSDPAGAAIDRAGRLFRAARALVACAWQPALQAMALMATPAGVPTYSTDDVAAIDRLAAERAEEVARQGVARAVAAGLEAEPVTVQTDGPVWRAIVELTEERRADAVVVGARGLSRVGSALLGSVSNGLVHHATVPVLVLPGPAHAS
jgi:nucleotide-binding universal stress UspA family protein